MASMVGVDHSVQDDEAGGECMRPYEDCECMSNENGDIAII